MSRNPRSAMTNLDEVNLTHWSAGSTTTKVGLRARSRRTFIGMSTLLVALAQQQVASAQPSAAPTPAPTTAKTSASAGNNAVPTAEAAPADPLSRCVAAFTEGQRLRNDGHLVEGRAEFLVCSQAACPAALRTDCITWSEELRSQIPSVSFRVTVDHKIAQEAKVFLDGNPLPSALEGRAVELNPGPHTARFEYADQPAQEQQFVAAEGERYRVIQAEFASGTSEPAPGVNTPEPAPGANTPLAQRLPSSPPAVLERPTPIATYVFLGVGAAAAINAVVWGLSATVTKNDLEATCSPNCEENKIDAVKQRALISDISTGASVLSLAGAVLTYYLRPEAPSSGTVEVGATNLSDHGIMGLVRVHTN